MVVVESANAKLSFVSRANCLPLLQVNESISYDLTGTAHQLYTFSRHQTFGVLHTYTVKSWRSYAGYNGDTGTSTVSGTHMLFSNGREYVYYTYATNCNFGEW